MDIPISEDGFLNALRSMNGGALVEELDRELINAVQAIFDHGGKAEITVKLKLNRIANMETAVNITPDVIVKVPKEERPSKAMFVTAGSGLTDQYQDQKGLPLGDETERGTPTLTAVDTTTGEIKG